MLTVPQPQSLYRGNYTSFPAATLKPPVEGNRTIPAEIFWLRDASAPSFTVAFNLRSQQVLSLSQICALHVDNTACSSTVNILFPDTNFQLALDAGMEGFYPVVTSGLEFYAWVSIAVTGSEHTVLQILNFLPPPMEFGQGAGSGGGSVGTVRTVATGTGLTGGPITDTGTVALVVPVAISSGGTSATTAAAALDQLAGASGGTTGSLTRAAGGTWSVNPAGTGSVTSVVAGNGLSGGTITTTGSIALIAPVSVANGGTGATTGPNALLQLGAAPINNPALTGIPTAPTAPNGTNNTQIASTGFVVNAIGSAGFGTVSGVVAGNGLTGGGTSGSVTVALASPVTVANGGTGAANATTALTNLGAVAKAGDSMTGALTVGANVSAFNYTISTGAAGDAGVFGFTNTNGPSVMCWGNTTGNAGALLVTTSGVERMRIANNGNATFSGSAGFSLAVPIDASIGNVFANGAFSTLGGGMSANLYYTGATWKYLQNGFGVLMSSNGAGGWQTYTAANSTAGTVATLTSTLVIDNLGNLQIGGPTATKPGGGSWVAPSDKQLKSSVEPFAAGLAEILQLSPTAYRYRDESWNLEDTDFVGLDAEAAAAVIPEMARSFTPPQPFVPPPDPDAPAPQPQPAPQRYAALDHGPLIFALINAVKELAAQVEALRPRPTPTSRSP